MAIICGIDIVTTCFLCQQCNAEGSSEGVERNVQCDVLYLAPDLSTVFGNADDIPLLVSRPGSDGGVLIMAESVTNTVDASWTIYRDYGRRLRRHSMYLTETQQAWAYRHSSLILTKDNRGTLPLCTVV
jgi:hypothetical protein